MRFLAPTSCALRYSRLPVSPWGSWWEQRYFGLLPFAVHLLLLVASLKARKASPPQEVLQDHAVNAGSIFRQQRSKKDARQALPEQQHSCLQLHHGLCLAVHPDGSWTDFLACAWTYHATRHVPSEAVGSREVLLKYRPGARLYGFTPKRLPRGRSLLLCSLTEDWLKDESHPSCACGEKMEAYSSAGLPTHMGKDLKKDRLNLGSTKKEPCHYHALAKADSREAPLKECLGKTQLFAKYHTSDLEYPYMQLRALFKHKKPNTRQDNAEDMLPANSFGLLSLTH
ncbi:hypothetical protein LUU34_00019100 [Aix galericulata]|nr:hypothetical protein LUU34_00019100 [Aix galericulata]